VTATAQVTNTGQSAAASVTPFLTSAGTGALRLLAGPVPSSTALLAPGATQAFTWTLAVDVPGSLALTLTAGGTDAASGRPAWGSAAAALTAATAASLTCAASVSSTRIALGQTVTLRYTVSDAGGIQADGVAPLLTLAGSGTLLVAAGPSPAPPLTIPGKGAVTFVWTLSGAGRGKVAITLAARGTGAITGGDASCAAGAAGPVEIVLVVTTVPPGKVKVFGGAQGWLEPASGVPARLIVHPTGAGTITTRIYDLKGRLLLERETASAGDEESTVEWDGTDAKGDRVPPGVYPVAVTGPGVQVRDKIAVAR